MEGIILSYNTNNTSELLQINNKLFGRVVRVKRKNKIHHYYYSGQLDDIRYNKLSNGCYFIEVNNIEQLTTDRFILDNINTIRVFEIDDNIILNTARQYFINKFNNIEVHNL